MKQLFQIQELHSLTCFLEDHGDKTYTNIFAILAKNLYPCLCLVLFWVTVSNNLVCFLIKADKQMDMAQVMNLTSCI